VSQRKICTTPLAGSEIAGRLVRLGRGRGRKGNEAAEWNQLGLRWVVREFLVFYGLESVGNCCAECVATDGAKEDGSFVSLPSDSESKAFRWR
jgi:hypothetical protein